MIKQKTNEELKEIFDRQLSLLRDYNNNYDNGKITYYISTATVLRTLLHDTKNSISLFKLMEIKNRLFFTSVTHNRGVNRLKLGASDLVIIDASPKEAKFSPSLNNLPPSCEMIPFEKWWNQKILLTSKQHTMLTRREIVLAVVNKEGGAHVDPKHNEEYHLINDGKNLSVTVNNEYIKEIIPPIIRQISFEVLKTIYYIENDPYPNLNRKELCTCGSKKKYKRCCLADRWDQKKEDDRFYQQILNNKVIPLQG